MKPAVEEVKPEAEETKPEAEETKPEAEEVKEEKEEKPEEVTPGKEKEEATEVANTNSTYLWCLLLEVSLGVRHEIVPHLTRILLQAFSHQAAQSDITMTHLPLFMRLLQVVKDEEQNGDFHAASFSMHVALASRVDVQLRAYLHFFTVLAFLPASVKQYTALLEQALGLESWHLLGRLTRRVYCLALRFFYLAKIRTIVKTGAANGLSAIA